MRTITIDPNKCMGCMNCVFTCSLVQKDEYKTSSANIRVKRHSNERICIPMVCMHCKEAWCLEVCPANAISRDEQSGAVLINSEECVGCKMCMLSCPMGNIHFDAEQQVSAKCDLCGDDPQCVRNCVTGALMFVEEEEAYQHKRDQADAKLLAVFARK